MSVSLADGGIETALTERLQQELPEFAAFVLLNSVQGRRALHDYYRPFIEQAVSSGLPLVLDTPTWRANPDWIRMLGYSGDELAPINTAAVAAVREVIAEVQPDIDVQVNGCVGPRFDDFVADQRMSPAEAEAYHAPQVAALAAAGVNRVTSVTTLDPAEGIGVVRAARSSAVPVAVSFTVGADGRLPNGASLAEAIAEVDAATESAAVGFLVNCAHPEEAMLAVRGGGGWNRLIGFRLNAAREGDDDAGDAPRDFAAGMLKLRSEAPSAELFGGCCGTDAPHIAAVADALSREAGESTGQG